MISAKKLSLAKRIYTILDLFYVGQNMHVVQ